MQKKLYIVVVLLSFVAFGLEMINVNLSGKLAADSVSIKKIQNDTALLEEENQILNTKVLQLTSFETIASRAAEMGFVQEPSYITLQNQVKLSYSQ